MDLEYIEQLLEIFAQAPVMDLELAEGEWRIRLSKAGLAARATAAASPTLPGTGFDPVATPRVEQAAPETQKAHVIAAGLAGTFYRRPAPDKPPFVAVGDLVKEGQTLGVMEAMKMMIAVEADVAGRISEILKEDGVSVQAGAPLFALVPADQP